MINIYVLLLFISRFSYFLHICYGGMHNTDISETSSVFSKNSRLIKVVLNQKNLKSETYIGMSEHLLTKHK